jgi:GNAT superfamily N-acetyltransferase
MTHDQAVRLVTHADIPQIAHMLAAAFQDDPVTCFIFPDPVQRRKRLPAFFRVIYNSDAPKGACYMTANGEAATTWRAPGFGKLSLLEMAQQAWPWIESTRENLTRALIFSAASDAHHPKQPHWYLHIAGCLPEAQGKGFGGAAISAGIARAEADGVAAYLETSNEGNLPIYNALGFAVTEEWSVRKQLKCWSMLRASTR